MEPLEGNGPGASKPDDPYTRQQRIAQLARQSPQMGFTSLAHHIDLYWLYQAYERTRPDGAPGVDGQNARGLRGEPWSQSPGAAGPSQVRHVSGTAGAAGAHSQGDPWRHAS